MKIMPRVNLGENKNFKLFRFGIFEHFPGQLVPMPNHSFGEEISPTSNLNLLWSNLGLFAHSGPFTCYWGEDTNPHLSTTFFQVFIESDKHPLKADNQFNFL